MKRWMTAVIFGFAIVSVSSLALAREEQWDVSVQGWQGTFHVEISDNGNVTGMSDWPPNASGQHNTLTGNITGSRIALTRHLEGQNAGATQTYSGQYINNRTAAQGKMSGTGGPGDWTATVTVIKE